MEKKQHNYIMSNFQSSASSRNDIIESTGFYPPQILQPSPQFPPPPPPPPQPLHDQPPPQPPPPASKKRSLPDPDAEVIALSPKSLQATNRFLCEICNKGFQRDQNLQLHRRGHNLPWKLKQRSKGEVVRKKVYVCPEPSCVHHHPSRALGDLTGIKKHFFRKHGEKKWKCDKCTKRYAVQSDWKAHSKVCGTREYKCDCGTIFSRRDSFITHRAFCDALAQETSRPINGLGATNALLNPGQLYNHQPPQQSHLGGLSIKRELQDHQQQLHLFSPTQLELFFSGGLDPTFPNHQTRSYNDPKNFNTSSVDISASNTPYHMSATALLQRAAQMGPTMSQPMTHQGSSGFVFPSASEEAMSMSGGNGFFAHGNNNGHHMMRDPMMTSMMSSSLCYPSAGPGVLEGLSYSNDSPFDHDGLVGGMLNNTQNINENEETTTTTTTSRGMKPVESTEQSVAAKRKRSSQGMTRDFLGLKDASGFDMMRNSSTSSDHVMSNNNGGQQVMKDNRDQNNDQYTYFGRVE